MVTTIFQGCGTFNTLINFGTLQKQRNLFNQRKNIGFSKIIQIVILVVEHIYLRILSHFI